MPEMVHNLHSWSSPPNKSDTRALNVGFLGYVGNSVILSRLALGVRQEEGWTFVSMNCDPGFSFHLIMFPGVTDGRALPKAPGPAAHCLRPATLPHKCIFLGPLSSRHIVSPGTLPGPLLIPPPAVLRDSSSPGLRCLTQPPCVPSRRHRLTCSAQRPTSVPYALSMALPGSGPG